MVEGWKTYTIEELCSHVVDCPHSTPKWTEDGVLVLRSNNIRNGKLNYSKVSFTDHEHYQRRIKRAIPQGGDIIITREAPMGEVCILPEGINCCMGQRMVLLRPVSEKIVNEFLLYALQSRFVQTQIKIYEGTGSTVSNLRIPVLKGLNIPYPPLPEQRAIASILSALDDKIELNLQMNKTLEDMAMTLYKHWFVDFGPFQEGEMVDSELGEIPKGWEVKTLADFIELNPRLRLAKGVEAPFVEMKVLPVAVMSVPEAARKEFKGGAKFQNGDTLFARITPCLENGKTAFVDFLKKDEIAFGSTEFLVMRAKNEVSKYWTYCLARDANFRKFAISTMVGTSGRQRVQNEPFLRYALAKAPFEIFDSFTHIVGPWFGQIRLNTVENHTLTTLRDTLLPKLISGEVRVKEAEKIITQAL